MRNLHNELHTLAVFRSLLSDPVIEALDEFLVCHNESAAINAYSNFVAKLYATGKRTLAGYVQHIVNNDENAYIRMIGQGLEPWPELEENVRWELNTLQRIADLTPDKLRRDLEYLGHLPGFAVKQLNIAESYWERCDNIGSFGYGPYAKYRMFYLDQDNKIVPVVNPDGIRLESLVDYKREQQIILDNTLALLAGKPAANILLTGDAGTGKSSTVKAVANALWDEGLRLIEVRKDQLRSIPGILDELSGNPLKFVLFIDDLSFSKDDDSFNGLKAVLEGSVAARSANVVVYATSNRRHLIKETFSDREGDDVHRNDTMQELASLSERFGIHITFSKPNKETFLRIVHRLAEENGIGIPESELDLLAERFALERGGRSARIAKQLVDGILSR